MTSQAVTDTVIFAKLREHLAPTKMSQLIVDITNQAMTDDTFRNEVIDRLELSVKESEVAGKRPYNLTIETLKKVDPNVNPAAVEILLRLGPQYGIITKKQMCAFIANCVLESQGFNAKRESFNYRPERLRAVFPSRIKSIADAKALLAKGQVAVANYLYGGRYGNRPNTNDGWDYRGGGWTQNTFRANYFILQNMTGIKFGDNPKLIEDMENAAIAAMEFWRINGCNEKAEKINTYSNGYTLNTLNTKGVETRDYKMNYGARIIRETVNGGLNGYTEFCQSLEKCLRYL